MYEKILRDPLLFPDEVSPSARSILTGLLTRDPAQRLGVNGADEIKRHPFFEKIDWRRLAQKKIQPPFKPSVRGPVDVSNFDTVFTAEQPLDSVVEGSQLSQTVQAQFEGTHPSPGTFLCDERDPRLTLLGPNPSAPYVSPCLFCRVFVQCAWNRRTCGLMAEGRSRSS
jgi:serine/threonine protein kinase